MGYLQHVHAVVQADIEGESHGIGDAEGPETDILADEVAAHIYRVDCNTATGAWRRLMFPRMQPKGR